MLRFVIVDKDEAFALKLERGLVPAEDIKCVGRYHTFAQFAARREKSAPDVVLVAMELRDAHIQAEIRQTCQNFSGLPIFLLVDRADSVALESLLRDCAKGCALKADSCREIEEGIRAAHRGKLFVSSSLTSNLLQHVLRKTSPQTNSGVSSLTDRELTIFQLMGAGLGMTEIAQRLGLSARTVESHREKIKHRLGFNDAATLTHFAFLWSQRELAGSEQEKELLSLALNRRSAGPRTAAAESLR